MIGRARRFAARRSDRYAQPTERWDRSRRLGARRSRCPYSDRRVNGQSTVTGRGPLPPTADVGTAGLAARRPARSRPPDHSPSEVDRACQECTSVLSRLIALSTSTDGQETRRRAFDGPLTSGSVERSVSEEVLMLLLWVSAVVLAAALAASIVVLVRMRPSDAAPARGREVGTSGT
jgi:hypothetical protein